MVADERDVATSASPQREYTYLCLLDDLDLNGDVRLGDWAVRSLGADELRDLLYASQNTATHRPEAEDLTLYSLFAWASCTVPEASTPAPNSPLSGIPPGVLDKTNFFWRNLTPGSNWPFDEMLRVLNLLKPAGGPVIARQLCMAPNPEFQVPLQVIVRSYPCVRECAPDGRYIPYLAEYELGPDDMAPFEVLSRQIAQGLSPAGANPHLENAIHLFGRADQELVPFPGTFQCLDPLLAYEAALEALVLREHEGASADRLSRRVAAIFGGQPPLIRDFARRIHWLRSKAVHAVRSAADLATQITAGADGAIADSFRTQLGTPAGNYSSILLKVGRDPFPGLLINLREVVRRCIRFFLVECQSGRPRDETLDALDRVHRS